MNIAVSIPPGAGKSTLLKTLFREIGDASPGSLRRRIVVLDLLHDDLENRVLPLEVEPYGGRPRSPFDNGVPYADCEASVNALSPTSWHAGGAVPAITDIGRGPSTIHPSAAARSSAIPVVPFESPTDRSWYSSPGVSFASVESLTADEAFGFDARTTCTIDDIAGPGAWAQTNNVEPANGPTFSRFTPDPT